MIPEQHRKKAGIVAACIALAAPCEGLRRVAYYDPPGILTVCRGHTGKDVVKGKVYSDVECDGLMTADMTHAVDRVDACQPGLPPKVLTAFADAAYNIGPKVACDTGASTAARLLSMHDYDKACDQLPRWDKASVGGFMVSLPGLTKRRALERSICLQWKDG